MDECVEDRDELFKCVSLMYNSSEATMASNDDHMHNVFISLNDAMTALDDAGVEGKAFLI